MARAIGARRNVGGTEQRTAYRWDLKCHGRHILALHHPPTYGKMPHTRGPGAKRSGRHIAQIYWERGLQCPDLAIFSHCHDPEDGGPVTPHRKDTRAIHLGAWQDRTQFAHKVAGANLGTEHHAALITIWPDRNRPIHVEHRVYPLKHELVTTEVNL